ncbi:MAG: hypothetical protein EOP20_00125 [Hyphomicrobiales bacterium]|nr:MAG: hypothetical protein EOP20_00125 [Hyphomicrobiales bacterium]
MSLIMLAKEAFLGELGVLGESGVECTRLATLDISAEVGPTRAYVKAFGTTNGDGFALRGLVNEVAGYFCADAAGLPVPPRAGLIVVEPSMLGEPPEWMQPGSEHVCWWSEDVGSLSLRARFNWDALPDGSVAQDDALQLIREVLLRYPGTPSVIALDDLIANVDRNLGNVLCTPLGLSLIDHGHCLTGPQWVSSDLRADASYRNVVRQILDAAGDTLPYKSSIMAAYRQITLGIAPKLSELKELLDVLVDAGDAEAAHEFLSTRSDPPSIAHRMGVVA